MTTALAPELSPSPLADASLAPELSPSPLAAAGDQTFVLASQSPQRIQLLRDAGYQFTIHPANANEESRAPNILPSELAMQLAKLKADIVSALYPNKVVLAADTIVAFGDRIIGKPKDAAHARKIIDLLSGTTHIVITGVAVIYQSAEFFRVERVMSAVRMNRLTPKEIDQYVATNLWQGKAGACGLQDPNPIVRLTGGDMTNVIGLPMKRTQALLAEAGIVPPI